MTDPDRRIGVFNRDDSPMEFGAWGGPSSLLQFKIKRAFDRICEVADEAGALQEEAQNAVDIVADCLRIAKPPADGEG